MGGGRYKCKGVYHATNVGRQRECALLCARKVDKPVHLYSLDELEEIGDMYREVRAPNGMD